METECEFFIESSLVFGLQAELTFRGNIRLSAEEDIMSFASLLKTLDISQ